MARGAIAIHVLVYPLLALTHYPGLSELDAPTDPGRDAPHARHHLEHGQADRSLASSTHDQAWRYRLGLSPDLAFLRETLPPIGSRAKEESFVIRSRSGGP
jgi:hypothetical protein